MFFPFLDYVTVDVPTKGTGDHLLYTTSYPCMVYYTPIASRSNYINRAGVYVNDLDPEFGPLGGDVNLYFAPVNVTNPGPDDFKQWRSLLVPAGKQIRANVGGGSTLGGTIHIFRLPSWPV
jgi:hypothetical protein